MKKWRSWVFVAAVLASSGRSGGNGGAGGNGGGMAGTGGASGMPPISSSCVERRVGGFNSDGIDVDGIQITVYWDMTRFGGGWTEIYDQDVNLGGYLPYRDYANGVNLDGPNSGLCGILDLDDDFEGAVPGFEFLIDRRNDGQGYVMGTVGEPIRQEGAVSRMAQSRTNQVGGPAGGT